MQNRPIKVRKRRSMRLALAGSVAASSLFSARQIASAGTFNWLNYTSTSDGWSIGSDWDVASAPFGTDPTTSLVFGQGGTDSTYTAVDNLPGSGGAFILNSITFNTDVSGNITIAASTPSPSNVLTFSGSNAGITVNGTGTATISAPIAYAVNTTITNNSSNALTLSGAQTFKADLTTTFTGAGNYSIIIGSTTGTAFTLANGETIANGVLSGGETGSLTLSNGGSYFDSSPNVTINLANYSSGTFSLGNIGGAAGTVNILAGTITDGNTTGQMFASYMVLNVASTATFSFSNITDVMGALSGAGTVTGSNTSLTLAGSGYHDFSGILGISGAGYGSLTIDGSTLNQRLSGSSSTYAGTTFVQAGTLIVGANGALGSGSSSILVGDTTGALSASLLIDTLNVTIAGNITLQTGNTGTDTLGGTIFSSGTATFSGNVTMGTASAAAVPLTLTSPSGGTVVFSGNLLRAAGATGSTDTLTIAGLGTVTLQGADTFSGATTINGGTLVLDYTLNNATKLSSTGLLTLDGGSLSLTGNASSASSETVNGLTLLGGSGRVVVSSGASGSITLALGAITRDGTTNIGTVDFGLPTTGSVTTSISNTAAGAILGAWAIVDASTATSNLTDWAVINGGAIQGYSAAGGSYTTSFASGDQTSLSAAFALPSGGGITNSLRFTGTSALTFNGASDTLTLQSGGILVSSTVSGATSIGASGTAGIITTGGNELIVQQASAATTLTINSVIGASTRVVKAGAGNLTLAGTNTYTGGTYINAGSVTITAVANLGTATSSTDPIVLNGGSLVISTGTADFATTLPPLTVGPAGGTFNVGGTSTVLEFDGNELLGTGTLTKSGTGTLEFVSLSVTGYSGPVVIAASGGIIYQSGGYLNKVMTSLTIGSGGEFEYYDNGQNAIFGTGTSRIIINGTGVSSNGALYFKQQTSGTAPLTVDVVPDIYLATASSIDVSENSLQYIPVITVTGNLTGPGNFTKAGTGTLYLAGTDNTYTGTTTVSSGTLRVDASAVAAGPGVSISAAAGTLDVIVPSNLSFSAPLGTSTGTFLTEGPATLTFSTSNASFAGTLADVGGGVVLNQTTDNGNKFGATPAFILGSASLALNGNASSTSTQTFSGTTLQGGGSVTVNSGSGANATVALGAITRNTGGAFNFIENNPGSGTATITTITANTGTGILAGWATVAGTNWAVSTGTGTAAGPITPYAGYTTYVGGSAAEPASTSDVDFQASNTTAWTTQAINSLRFNTPGTAATLTLASANTLTATTGGILVTPAVGALTSTITGGSLSAPTGTDLVINQFNTADPLAIASAISNVAGTVYGPSSPTPPTATLAAVSGGGKQTVTLATGSTSNITIGEIVTGTGIGTTSNAHVVAIGPDNSFTMSDSATITVEGTAVNLTFTPNTNVVKTGPGQLTLSGTNTFSGVVYAEQGVLTVGAAATLGQTSTTTGTSSIYLNGGTIDLTATYAPAAGVQPWIVGPAGGTIQTDISTGDSLHGDQLYGSGPLIKTGIGNLNFGSDTSLFGGTITINAGSISETSSQLTYVSAVTVNAGGQFQINDNGTATYGFASGSILTLNGNGPGFGTSTTPGVFAETVQSPGPGPVSKFSDEVFLASDSRIGDWSATFSSVLYFGATNITGPVIGPGALIKDGPGTLTLSGSGDAWGTSTLLAGTIISNGTLMLGVTNALPTTTTVQFGESASGATASNNNSGTLDLASFSQTVAALTTQGGGTAQQIINSVAATPSTLAVNYSGGSADTFTGQIGGGTTGSPVNFNIALTKTGSGTLILGGSNTYTGATNVNAGGLIVKGSLAAGSTVTVASGAVLSGSGTVNGSTTVQSGGTIAASNGTAGSGATPTTLTVGSAGKTVSLVPGSSYDWGLSNISGAAGTNWDLLSVTGLLVTGTTGDVTIYPVALSASPGTLPTTGTTTWDIASGTTSTGAQIGTLASQFQLNSSSLQTFATAVGASAGFSFSVIDDTNGDVAIQYSQAPEPTSFLLTGLAAGGILLRRRRADRRPR